MKKIAISISLLFGLFLLGTTIQQVGIQDTIETVSVFSLPALIAVFLVNFFAICIIGSWRWKIIMEAHNKGKISFVKVIKAKLAGFAVSYITPSVLVGGEPVRAYLLKDEGDNSWEKSFASVIIDQVIYFFVVFLFMILGFIFLIYHFALPLSVLYGFSFIVLLSCSILYLFYTRMIRENSDGHGFFIFIIKITRLDGIKFIKAKEKNIEKMERVIADFFKNKKRLFVKAFFLAIIEILFYVITIWMIILCLDRAIDFTQAMSIFFILILANFVPIPGSLGSLEASLTFIFTLLEIGQSNGFVFSLIFRFINIILVVVGFVILVNFELKTISQHFSNKSPKIILRIHRFLIRIIRKRLNLN